MGKSFINKVAESIERIVYGETMEESTDRVAKKLVDGMDRIAQARQERLVDSMIKDIDGAFDDVFGPVSDEADTNAKC